MIITVGGSGGGSRVPCRRKIDDLVRCLNFDARSGFSPELRCPATALCGVPHGRNRVLLDLIGQRATGELIPCHLHRREIADGQIERDTDVKQTSSTASNERCDATTASRAIRAPPRLPRGR